MTTEKTPSTSTEPPAYPISFPADPLAHHRSRLSLAPQVDQTSPPWPQVVGTDSFSIPHPILCVLLQALSPVTRLPLFIIHLDARHFPHLLPIFSGSKSIARTFAKQQLADITIVCSNILTLFTTVAIFKSIASVLPSC